MDATTELTRLSGLQQLQAIFAGKTGYAGIVKTLDRSSSAAAPRQNQFYPPCVDGSELARTFFPYAALVGAPMCSAFKCGSHDRWP